MKDVAFELKRMLIESVQRDKARGLLFSGGLDSAILASANPNIKAITISLKSYGEDIEYSTSVAGYLNIKHFHRSADIDEVIEAIPVVIHILRSFDPALPNDLPVYFGLKLAKELGIKEVMAGDGSDELFAGYSFMQEIDDLAEYIKRISKSMEFSSNKIGEFFGIKIVQPFIDKKIVDFALQIPVDLKIKESNGKVWGKWILRKAFEDILPEEIIWQKKRPLEYGSGMRKIREIISSRVCDEEFKEASDSTSVKFMNKEHFYYYRIYRNVVGEITKPKHGEKACPGCGAEINPMAFHCKVCGYVLVWNICKNGERKGVKNYE